MKTILRFVLIMVIISLMTCSVFAERYVLMEGTTGTVIRESSGEEQVNAGALTKLMTALITAEKIENGELTSEKLVAVHSSVNNIPGAIVWLMSGERITVHELLKGLLIGNANDCSVALACEIAKSTDGFIELMNTRAKELGMLNTVYADCVSGCTTTAKDMAILCREISKHEILKQYMITWMDYIRNGETMLVNNNKLVRSFDGIEGILAGNGTESGYCVASSATRDNEKYICVVMGETEDNAFLLSKELLNLGFSAYSLYTPEFDNSLIKPISVEKGVKREVEIALKEIPQVVISNGMKDKLQYELQIAEKITAPVSKNQEVGSLIFKIDDEIISQTSVVTTQKVEKMTVWKYFVSFMKSFFVIC